MLRRRKNTENTEDTEIVIHSVISVVQRCFSRGGPMPPEMPGVP